MLVSVESREIDYKIYQVESGSLTEPLWDTATVPHPYPSNAAFVCEYTIKLLSSSFPNMTTSEVRKTRGFACFFNMIPLPMILKLLQTGDVVREWTLQDEKQPRQV